MGFGDFVKAAVNPTSVIGTVGGAALTGGLGYMGAKETNQSNERIATARNLFEKEEAERARGFSSEEASILRQFNKSMAEDAMGFSERMSSTAIQRRMEDMKKAGINPILAGKYDASSPAGAMATGSQPATAKANAHGYTAINEMQGFLDNVSTVLDLKMKTAQVKKAEAETSFTNNKINMTDPVAAALGMLGEYIKDAREDSKPLRDEGFKTFKNALSGIPSTTSKGWNYMSNKAQSTWDKLMLEANQAKNNFNSAIGISPTPIKRGGQKTRKRRYK